LDSDIYPHHIRTNTLQRKNAELKRVIYYVIQKKKEKDEEEDES
jgi:hypothetical protein